MKIESYQLTHSSGDMVTILNYGARIQSWQTTVNGQSRNIVLGHQRLEKYLKDTSYLGAIAGPYANRIKHALVKHEKLNIQLAANEGNNILHGGKNALESQFWQVEERSDDSITLVTTLADGYNGFPGPMSFYVSYTLSENELLITMNVITDKHTIAGPTGHAYFNLSGMPDDIFSHALTLNAKTYTPVDKENIPTGSICPVQNTAFDFLETKSLKQLSGTYLDHNFMISESNEKPCAALTSPSGDLTLQVYTDYPAMQIYDGTYLTPPFAANQGLCIEPQFPPNAPNQQGFPFELTTPDKPLKKTIRYCLLK